jgi:hypothetical protein
MRLVFGNGSEAFPSEIGIASNPAEQASQAGEFPAANSPPIRIGVMET